MKTRTVKEHVLNVNLNVRLVREMPIIVLVAKWDSF